LFAYNGRFPSFRTQSHEVNISLGLHQVIVIPDTDSTSFKNAVDEAFSEILRGRPWHPLVARLCDAKNLFNLPMLRQLPPHLIGSNYDAAFLQQHCAVSDDAGKILDLYIAMSEDTISWAELRDVTPFKPGLEASWTYDPYLDALCVSTDATDGPETSHPAAGDLLRTWSPTLKRNASQISRTPSFGSSDSEGSRKIHRTSHTTVEVVRQHAETV
jgi:hypothetical protein